MGGFTSSRDDTLAAIYRMGTACCSYSGTDEWAERCDCKYGIGEHWPTMHEKGNGCPELRSLHAIVAALTDEEWSRLMRRSGGIPSGFVLDGEALGSRLHAAEAAAAMAADNIARVRSALAEGDPNAR